MGSVARQLVHNSPADAFRAFNYNTTDGIDIIRFLEATLDHARRYFIVLDGLDECEEAQVKELAEIFHNLLLSSQLRIGVFWSSRSNVLSWLPERFLTKQHIDLETQENQGKIARDIGEFTQHTLEEWLEGDTPELQINNPTVPVTIRDRLEKEAQGMYVALIS